MVPREVGDNLSNGYIEKKLPRWSDQK